MKTLTLRNRFQNNSTLVENDFIDHYMVKANGEYIKVYLLLLRHLHTPNCSLTISMLADLLECTEKDIARALNYWANEKLLKIDYDEHGVICGLSLGCPCVQESASSKNALKETVPNENREAIMDSKTTVKNQDELKQLYFVAEQYIGKPLSVSDIQKINYFFDQLNFSTDLIEYLIEYCVENGHKSMHYIESVALAWSEANISSVTEAKASSAAYSKNCFAVLKAFGIKGRNPAPVEISYIKKWTDEYGFTLDIITEACNRTIAHTSKPDFKYADSILRNWFQKDVRHFADISRLDQAYQQNKLSGFQKKASISSIKRQPVKSASASRFNNFESRSYDISSLEQQLLNTP